MPLIRIPGLLQRPPHAMAVVVIAGEQKVSELEAGVFDRWPSGVSFE